MKKNKEDVVLTLEQKKKQPQRFLTQIRFLRLANYDNTQTPISTFKVHVTKGLLVKDSDGLFDVDHKTNKRYIIEAKEQNRRRANGLDPEPMNKVMSGAQDMELEMKEIALSKAKEDLAILELKRQKAEGVVIPFEAAAIAFQIQCGEIFQSFKNASEQIAALTVQQLGGTTEQAANVRGKLVEILNSSISEAKEAYTNKITVIQDDFKTTR